MSGSTAAQVVAWLTEQLGAELTPWQVELLERAFGTSQIMGDRGRDLASRISVTCSRRWDWRDPAQVVLYARELNGPGACPTCYLPDGFHDHGEVYSRHDALTVPRHLVRISANRARREERQARRHTEERNGTIV